MKKKGFLTTLLLGVSALCLAAGIAACEDKDTQEVNQKSFILNEDGTGYTVVNHDFYDVHASNWALVIPSTYKNLPVTAIGEDAFDNIGLISVTIPDSVTVIEKGAFRSCKNLTSVTIGNGVTSIGNSAFSGCESLTNVVIPDSVTSIGERTFYACDSLTSITLPDGITSIEKYTFDGCSSLTSISIPDGVTSIGYYAFHNCRSLMNIEIPDSVTSIENLAFRDCNALTSIIIPDSVTYICNGHAFQHCSSLTNIYYEGTQSEWKKLASDEVDAISNATKYYYRESEPTLNADGIAYDGNYWSYGENGQVAVWEYKLGTPSEGLEYSFNADGSGFTVTGIGTFGGINLVIPSKHEGHSVTAIGAQAFEGCDQLLNVMIPDSVTHFGESAFHECENLKRLYYEGNIEYWCAIDFADYYANPLYYAGDFYIEGELVTELIIPDTVTKIKPLAFVGCTSLTSVDISDSVTAIGWSAFYECKNITRVKLPKNLTEIEFGVFRSCSFTEIDIPESVTKIGETAFQDTELTSIQLSNSITEIGEAAFYMCGSLTSIQFKGTVEEWNSIVKGADWNTFMPLETKVVCSDGTVTL